MNLAETTLSKLQSEDILVDVFTDHYDESLYGFIRNFNDKYLLLENYDDNGFYDGIIVFKREDITRIKWDNNGIQSHAQLITRHKQIEDFANIKIDNLENIIKSISNSYNCLTIMIQDIESDWTIVGQLIDMDDDTIIVNEFGTMSTLDRGMLMISSADITRIGAGSIYEKNLLKTHIKNN
ncbi:MAG TPA: hypothetical protein VIK55_19755 [Paludibacter sp.]